MGAWSFLPERRIRRAVVALSCTVFGALAVIPGEHPPGLHHQSQKPLCLAGAGGLPDQRKGGIRVRTWPRPGGPMMQCLRPGRDHRPRFWEFWEMQGYHLRRKRRRSSSTWTRTFAVLVRIPSVLVVLWTAIRMCRSPSTTGDGSG